MPRDDVYNEDVVSMIAVVCYQPLGNSRDDWWSKRIVEIANEIAFWQLDLRGIAVNATDRGPSVKVWW